MAGLLSRGATITRFSVYGEMPESGVVDWLSERLEAMSFRPMAEYESKTVGWVSVEDMLIPAGNGAWLIGDYIALAMRVDERKVSSAALKLACREEEARVMKERQIPRLSRGHRNEIKENMVLKLTKAAPPEPKVCDLFWDINKHEVVFFSASAKDIDILSALFKETFGLTLVQIIPVTAMLREMRDDEDLIAYAECKKFGEGFDLVDLITASLPVSRQWLTWLWYLSDTDPVVFEAECTIEMRSDLTVVGEASKAACYSDTHNIPEARAGLREGGKVSRAKMYFTSSNGTRYSVAIDSRDLRMTVKIPRVIKETDTDDITAAEGRILDAIGQYVELCSMVDGTLRVFGRAWFGREWNTDGIAHQMDVWATGEEV